MKHIKLFENFTDSNWDSDWDNINDIMRPYIHELEDELDMVKCNWAAIESGRNNNLDEEEDEEEEDFINTYDLYNLILLQKERVSFTAYTLSNLINEYYIIFKRMELDLVNSGYEITSNLDGFKNGKEFSTRKKKKKIECYSTYNLIVKIQ